MSLASQVQTIIYLRWEGRASFAIARIGASSAGYGTRLEDCYPLSATVAGSGLRIRVAAQEVDRPPSNG
jgi:hypothetical protein